MTYFDKSTYFKNVLYLTIFCQEMNQIILFFPVHYCGRQVISLPEINLMVFANCEPLKQIT